MNGKKLLDLVENTTSPGKLVDHHMLDHASEVVAQEIKLP